jgi:hypothetical protein
MYFSLWNLTVRNVFFIAMPKNQISIGPTMSLSHWLRSVLFRLPGSRGSMDRNRKSLRMGNGEEEEEVSQ